MDDFLSEIPSAIPAGELKAKYPDQWAAGEAFANAKFEVLSQVLVPPSTHEEMVDHVRRVVRGTIDSWRIKMAQQAGIDAALSPGGEAFISAIGMGLGTRLTLLLTNYLQSGPPPRAHQQSGSSVDDPRVASASFYCDQCGERASTISVIPPGVRSSDSMGIDVLEDQLRLQYDYWGETTLVIDQARAAQVRELLSTQDARQLHSYSVELARFYCPYCDRSYCHVHMQAREHLNHAILIVPA
jgi:hypothetical protein